MTRLYLDWNATTPLRPEAKAAMGAAMEVVGNPSSVHAEVLLGVRGYRLSPLESAPATGAHGATSGIDRAASDGLTTTENPHGVDDVGDGVFASSALAARGMASAAVLPLTKATRADPLNGSRWRGGSTATGAARPRRARLEVQVTTANGGFSDPAAPACLH